MHMRGIVSVLLLIPFLFCSCGRKRRSRNSRFSRRRKKNAALLCRRKKLCPGTIRRDH